ncbi:FeoA family protein [Methanolacinia paynteri]|uniref:FeoA family protein n=1 Tax=Methanolacinia paynteri TaxID=230356 RepID=UPI00064EA513|nr:FeoA family protein [Methanolacinia paynteri]
MVLKKLCDLSAGEKGKISEISRYRNESECMGLYPGIMIEVLTKDSSKGPCIIKTESGRMEIVMKREIASHMQVEKD